MNFSSLLEPIVYDSPEACPYLPGRTSRLPLRYPLTRLTPGQFDQRLAQGDRRSGQFLYRPACPQCRACESLRIEVEHFRPSATQRRTLRRGDRLIETRIGPPAVDDARVALFNKHRRGRDLARYERDVNHAGYESFLVETCCETVEFSYWLEGALIGAAVSDRGAAALSAVYCYFDPEHSRLSPGVYNVLKHVETCRAWGMRYLYLGFYIAASEHMSYKAQYLPHERFIGGQWRRFDRDA
jgi:arginine-tRNA-protein transferase